LGHNVSEPNIGNGKLAMSRSIHVVLLVAMGTMAVGAAQDSDSSQRDLVGYSREDYIVTPVNQRLTPFGRQIDLPGLRPQVIRFSPDGKSLLVSGKTSELLVLDPDTGEIKQRVALPSDEQQVPVEPSSGNILKPDRGAQVSFTGLVVSPTGREIYLSNVGGSIKVFRVDERGEVHPSHSISLPAANAPRRKPEIPSGLVLSEDGSRLYVCGNLSNRILEVELASGRVTRSFDVGVAPYDVVLAGRKLFVSNWGGRRPVDGTLTGPAGRGTTVRVDPVRHIANEGSVSVIDLDRGAVSAEVLTGLHASGLAASPDQRWVVCANAASDHLSVIDVATEQVVETIWAKAKPSDLFGASPNAVAFADGGQHLLVANGTQNAIGVFRFEPEEKGKSRLIGLIPVGWFPGAVAVDSPRNRIGVANIKGLPRAPKPKDGTAGFNSHHHHGSVSVFQLPHAADLSALSEQVASNMRSGAIEQAFLPPRPDQPPRAIPERIGEPSLINHVVYIIKENRTYDQIFGALGRGRGRPELCVFGREITPNEHKLVDEFVLLDNTYCAGILSADGHQWSTTAIATDYLEKNFADFPRSYPDGMGIDEADALAYSPAGFIWDAAIARGISIRNYGEFMLPQVRWRDPAQTGTPPFLTCYRTWKKESDDAIFESEPAIESIRAYSPTGYVGWEMSVPDQARADFLLRELAEFESRGDFPQLVIVCLPNDHTSGTKPDCPTPAACVADNDLAFGRIVEGLSHSKFWPRMAIFAIEDDPQAGWDHVSGYRTTAFCVSPYAKRASVVSTQYNTTSVLRTIEQILGIPPMNQFDASATPMFDCFSDLADPAPFESVANNIPLDQMNAATSQISDPQLREDAEVSARLNFAAVDQAPEDVLNRILWRAMKGARIPFPEWAISQVDDDGD
jgi:YVTN family beta-propeller protein